MSHIQMQCRRGMLELDFIFERFLKHQYEQLPDDQKKLFSQLLNEEDPTLYDWLIVGIPCADAKLQEIIKVVNTCDQCL